MLFFLFIKSLREPSPLRRGEAHPTRAAAAGGSRLPRGRHTAGDGDGFGARLCPRRAVRQAYSVPGAVLGAPHVFAHPDIVAFFFFFLVEVMEAQRGQGTRPKPHSYGEVEPGPEPCVGFVRRAL